MEILKRYVFETAFSIIRRCNILYDRNPLVKWVIDTVFKMNKHIFAFMIGMRLEPDAPLWILCLKADYMNGLCPRLSTSYHICTGNYLCKPEIYVSQHVANMNTHEYELVVAQIPSSDTENADSIMLSRLIHPNMGASDFEWKKSPVYFLVATYKCGRTCITFDIPRKWFAIGNVLFTHEHVLMLLESQMNGFDFDPVYDSYSIEVMDSNLNIFSLDETKYIVLDGSATGYHIVEYEADTDVEDVEPEAGTEDGTDSIFSSKTGSLVDIRECITDEDDGVLVYDPDRKND